MKTIVVLFMLSSAFGQKPPQAEPRGATLAQQKTCADQARKTFHEDNPTRPEHAVTWDYTSHYEARTNVCYIMTHFVQTVDGKANLSYAVYDAIEGRSYADFLQLDGHTFHCSITPTAKDDLTCHTSDEFMVLVEKYFGVGR